MGGGEGGAGKWGRGKEERRRQGEEEGLPHIQEVW